MYNIYIYVYIFVKYVNFIYFGHTLTLQLCTVSFLSTKNIIISSSINFDFLPYLTSSCIKELLLCY